MTKGKHFWKRAGQAIAEPFEQVEQAKQMIRGVKPEDFEKSLIDANEVVAASRPIEKIQKPYDRDIRALGNMILASGGLATLSGVAVEAVSDGNIAPFMILGGIGIAAVGGVVRASSRL